MGMTNTMTRTLGWGLGMVSGVWTNVGCVRVRMMSEMNSLTAVCAGVGAKALRLTIFPPSAGDVGRGQGHSTPPASAHIHLIVAGRPVDDYI